MFYTKKDLLAAIERDEQDFNTALIVSVDRHEKDAPGTFKGKKGFCYCQSHEEYVEELSTGEHKHEVLPDKFQTPCWVYMDIDEASDADPAAKEAATKKHVKKVLRAFNLCKQDIGKTAQVLTSHSPTKLSIHVVINIVSFPAEVAVRMERVDESVPWDSSVYSMFRSYRAPFHTKGGKEWRLVPWGASSKHLKDHLVRILPGHNRRVITSVTSVRIPEEKKKTLDRKRKAPASVQDECRDEVISKLADTRLLEQIGAESLDTVLGPSKRKEGSVFVYIRNGFTCLIRKDRHKSNQGYLCISHNSITYHCLSPGCKGKSVSVPHM